MLNPRQLEACTLPDGPALIIAGAGTGKTHTLTQRLVYLIAERKIKPEHILVLTFTHKAAEEMKARAEEKLGQEALGSLNLGTFHQLGLRLLREEHCCLKEISGIKVNFIICDRLKQEESMKELKIYEAYQKRLRETNSLDFDDLILLPIAIFKKFPEVLHKYQKLFSHILVDEYQDLDKAQYELLKLIAAGHHNLWAIGDSDQAIYSFRGGTLKNFLEFKKDYPEARSIPLVENYRSSEIIIKASQSLIEKNTGRPAKKLLATIKEGPRISVWLLPDEEAEARTVTRQIQKGLGEVSHYQLDRSKETENISYARSFSDFAVLYRLHSQSLALTRAFQESGLPYQVIGGSPKEKMKRIEELLIKGAKPEDIPLLRDIDFFDSRAEAVTLMTLHAAKGLEFPVVFIVGLEDGLLPYEESKQNLEEYEEERRLFYVGLTRGKVKLHLLLSRSRLLYGQRKTAIPSPFLKELPEELLERNEIKKRKTRMRQLNLWEMDS